MKRFFTLLFTFSLFSYNVNAQMADGSVVPNFTATGIDGQEYDLYSVLDEGYTVVIDVFATWCGPCWSYHETHTLADVWDTYGPDSDSDRKIFVFGVEGDNGTTNEDLIGTGSSTLGDWTDGVPYPMIDDGAIADLLQISYYPTIYHICQNRIISEAGQLSDPAAFYDLGGSCASAAGANNAGIIAYEGYNGTICGDVSFAPFITLQNLGTSDLTATKLELSMNSEVVQTINWEGTLGTFSTEEITFEEITISGNTNLEITASDVNGGSDEDTANNSVGQNINAAAIMQEILTVEINTDEYGNETYWAVVDENGEVIGEGGNAGVGLTNIGVGAGSPPSDPGEYAANSNYVVEVTVPAEGCYDFIITDFWGDGICCAYGNGNYKVTNAAGDILFEGGEFEASTTQQFARTFAVSNEDVVLENSLNVFPNPVSEQLNVAFDLAETTQLSITIHNALGQIVDVINTANYVAGAHIIPVNTNDFTNGMYMLTIQSESGSVSSKFTVSK